MKEIRNINILAIESSCDETAAAVVHNGRKVLSNIISSQIDLHKLYGGVVPEIASRKHIEKINQVIEEALKEAEVTLKDIDAVAVTYGPGLVGGAACRSGRSKGDCLCGGASACRRASYRRAYFGKLYRASRIRTALFVPCCIRGHTHLVCVKDYGKYEILEETRMMRQEKLMIK